MLKFEVKNFCEKELFLKICGGELRKQVIYIYNLYICLILRKHLDVSLNVIRVKFRLLNDEN